MERHEPHFRKLLDDAAAQELKLKYIASFDNGKASVGLRAIGPDHNFANLSGKDNAVLFYTNRYADQPLVIKGAGAGAEAPRQSRGARQAHHLRQTLTAAMSAESSEPKEIAVQEAE